MIADTITLQIKNFPIAETNLRRFERLSSTVAKPLRYVFNPNDPTVISLHGTAETISGKNYLRAITLVKCESGKQSISEREYIFQDK